MQTRITELLDFVQLPPHIHATILTDRDPYGTPLAVPVVWADRITDACPRCWGHVRREVECPLALNGGACAGGRIESRDMSHHCGEWLPVLSRVVEVDVTADDAADRIEQAAYELAVCWREELERERGRVAKRLARELRWAMDALSAPLGEGEDPLDRIHRISQGIRDTGEQVEPGLYLDPEAGAWVCWDYDPAGVDGSDILQEEVRELTYQQAATMLGVTPQQVATLAADGRLHGEAGRVSVASVLARMREAV